MPDNRDTSINTLNGTYDPAYKAEKINIVSNIVILGFVLSVIYHYVMAAYAGNGYPYNTFLFYPADRFNDFFNPLNQSRALDPYFGEYFFKSNYYPFAHILLFPFTLIEPSYALLLYLSLMCLAIAGIVAGSLSGLPKADHIRNVFVFSFMSYPALFTYDRANLEGILFILMYIFLTYWPRGKGYIGSIALSAAIAIKAFPAVFLSLLVSMKKYRLAVLTVLFTVLITLASASLLHGGLQKNVSYFLSMSGGLNTAPMIQANNLVQRGVSLYTLIKMALIETDSIYDVDINLLLKYYTWTVLTLFLALSFFITKEGIRMWEKVFLIVAAMLLFPNFSAEYKLLHLYLPLIFFARKREVERSDTFYAVMFGLLLIPKDYYFFKKIISDSGVSDISIGVVANIIFLLIMTLSIIVRRTAISGTNLNDHTEAACNRN